MSMEDGEDDERKDMSVRGDDNTPRISRRERVNGEGELSQKLGNTHHS